MKLSRHLAFALSSAWQSFWRNAAVSLAAVISITLILAFAGVNLILGHALDSLMQKYLKQVAVMNVSVQDDVPLPTVEAFMTHLRQDRRVLSATFITKEEAFQHFAANSANRDIVA